MATRAPPVQIPWIGYRFELSGYVKKLEAAGFVVERSRDASSALTLVQQRRYPLLIVQDWLPSGHVDCTPAIGERNPTEFTKYFLAQLRALPNYKEKPIIIPSFLDGQEAEKLKLDNNIFLFDALNGSSGFDGLVTVVKSHL